MDKKQEWTNERDLNNMSIEELRADFKLLTEINKDIVKLNGVLLDDLKQINKLLDIAYNDPMEALNDAHYRLYDEQSTNQAHRIAAKYK